MYLLWWVYYSSPKRVTDLFGRACIYCSGFTYMTSPIHTRVSTNVRLFALLCATPLTNVTRD